MAEDNITCSAGAYGPEIPAPELAYLPRDPKSYRPSIGLVGCGGITAHHLAAYKAAKYRVVALCDVDRAKAESRRKQFFPKATVYTDYGDLLKHEGIEVVDTATHPEVRGPIIKAALRAGKHVLSQKPFALDLDKGQKLVDLADRHKVKLAVNQNGRWAPHFSYVRNVVAAGLIGDVMGAHLAVHWDHGWTAGTVFDKIRHLILYDFAIHWFDMLCCIMGDRPPRRVYASMTHTSTQKAKPPLLAQALVEYKGAQATLVFDADTRFGARDSTVVTGTKGTLTCSGPDLNRQSVTLYTEEGFATPRLEGTWFTNGFHGTMGELLCAIEEDREPSNSALNNLRGLALCFAATASAETHRPKKPGQILRMNK
ncbi:MAG: Gfo/Idh/MocA family oxidoreductase [Candidatus Hydrogenedentes bacterium]|nr:Gfo/Idh/MocA family oxidoreductase [Candidatus Hydrogenedentota bacterium]